MYAIGKGNNIVDARINAIKDFVQRTGREPNYKDEIVCFLTRNLYEKVLNFGGMVDFILVNELYCILPHEACFTDDTKNKKKWLAKYFKKILRV